MKKGILIALVAFVLGAVAMAVFSSRRRVARGVASVGGESLAVDAELSRVIPRIDLESVPFDQAIAVLRKLTPLQIDVDDAALASVKFDRQAPVTLHLQDMPLWQILHRASTHRLEQDVVTCGVCDDRILVSTQSWFNANLIVRIYDVRNLMQFDGMLAESYLREDPPLRDVEAGKPPPEAVMSEEKRGQELVWIVQGAAANDFWENYSGVITIWYWAGRLVVVTTWDKQRAVRTLLARMAAPPSVAYDAAAGSNRDDAREAPLFDLPAQLQVALNERIPIMEWGTPFNHMVETLREDSGADLRVRWKVLDAAGFDHQTPVTCRLGETSLRTALDELCSHRNDKVPLGYVLSGGSIVLTTREDADSQPVSRIYNVRDLIPPPKLPGSPGPGLTAQPRLDAIDSLRRSIENNVAPDTWKNNGGSTGDLQEWHGLLIVIQTQENQRKISLLLDRLRRHGATN